MTPEQSKEILTNLLAQIEDPETLRQIVLLSSSATQIALRARDEAIAERDQIIAALLDTNAELAEDADRYTMLKYTVPHMLTVIAYSAQFSKDYYKSVEANVTPEILEASIDARIAAGDLDELLDQIDAAAEAELEVEQAVTNASAEVLAEEVAQNQLAALAERINEADTAYGVADEETDCGMADCPFCHPVYILHADEV